MSASEPRSHQRTRRSLLAGAAIVLARATTVVCGAALVPSLLSALGTERFARWSLVTGFSTLLAFADLGLGSSLVTALARAAAEPPLRRREQLSTAYLAALILGFVYAALGLGAHAILSSRAGGPPGQWDMPAETSDTLLTFALVFAASVPLGLVGRVRLGLQEGHVAAGFQTVGTLVGFVAVWLGLRFGLSLPWLVGIHTGAPVLFAALDTLYLLRRHPQLAPRADAARSAVAGELWQLGALFFSLQLAMAAAFASDGLVAAFLLGPEAVAAVAVHAQPFTWFAGVASVFFVALWPAYADALGRGERVWVAATLRRSLVLSTGGTVLLGLVTVGAGPLLFALWLGDGFSADRGLLVPLALTCVATTVGSALSMVLNAAGETRFQRRIALSMGTLVLLAKLLGAALFDAPGLLWGTLLGYLGSTLLPTLWFMRAWLGRAYGAENAQDGRPTSVFP
jgi:O-antigen/teichoic acid export membrane protein